MQCHRPQAGDVVWIRGRRWRVAGVRMDGAVARLDVAAADARRTFLFPFDRAVEDLPGRRPVRVRPQCARARFAGLMGRAFGARTPAAVIDADAAILPHQLEPVLAVIAGRRRILIADEVGLGKTVQAGLILAEVHRRNPAARAIVLAPAALTAQWRDELRHRFALEVRVADREGLDEHARGLAFSQSPWSGPGIWIASLDFLKQRHVVEALPARPWDLVVVDEAHAATGRSDRHVLVDHLGRRSRRLVLLTATPHSGDEERFARLLQVGRLDDDIVVFRRGRRDLGITHRRRVAWQRVRLSAAEHQVLEALGAFERTVLRAAGREGRDEARLLLSVFRKRALSTMGALARSIDRRAAVLDSGLAREPGGAWTQASFEFDAGEPDDVASAEDVAGLRARSGLTPDAERSWLQRLAHLSGVAAQDEGKVARLLRLLNRTTESAVVFTEFRDSLAVLARRLRLARPLAILHGGLTPAERADALGRFQTGEVSLLVATDVAGQGLNLQQRCRWVVSLELPWNPARLEQRIGRVDRIGQRRRAHLTLLLARHDDEAGLLAHLARRVMAARGPLGRSALIDIPPPEHAIRASVIDRTPIALTPASDPPPPICTTWARPARQLARRLEMSRAFARRWRGPLLPGRPIATAARSEDVMLVFSIPLFDGSGALVEWSCRAVRIAGSNLTSAAIQAAGHAAAASLAARIRRLRRLEAAAMEDQSSRERAIAAEIRKVAPLEAQPGLFDGRELRSFEAARMTAAEIDRDCDRALEHARTRGHIAAGRPVLEIVFVPRS